MRFYTYYIYQGSLAVQNVETQLARMQKLFIERNLIGNSNARATVFNQIRSISIAVAIRGRLSLEICKVYFQQSFFFSRNSRERTFFFTESMRLPIQISVVLRGSTYFSISGFPLLRKRFYMQSRYSDRITLSISETCINLKRIFSLNSQGDLMKFLSN